MNAPLSLEASLAEVKALPARRIGEAADFRRTMR